MTTQENNELEQMRRQMAILQGKLDKETIVNKRLMRESHLDHRHRKHHLRCLYL